MQADVEEPTETVAEQGRQVFEDNGCIGCHAIGGMGTAAGPALSNFANREVIAGYLENNNENLEAWIRDPESMKQGNNMPAFPQMSDEDMEALIAYLRSLNINY
jgi:cytochrome c oxidase subunit 2